ncbi:MAG: gliding motility-associated C-terminal domain-containing protein [Bacteroidota bacterium]
MMQVRLQVLLLLIFTFPVFGQKADNIWHFGRGCSMYFNDGFLVKTTGTPSVQPHKFSQYIFKVATICDNRTGELLFYTTGTEVMNRNHTAMPMGSFIANILQVMIVPDLLDSTLFTIFYTTPSGLFYTKVDMKLNGGLGGVVVQNQTLSTDAQNHFVVVKQYYGQGHWLIVSDKNGQRFYAYRITGERISEPVISVAGPDRIYDINDMRLGDMEATTTGNMFACTFKSASNKGLAGIYDFDKVCGTIKFNQTLNIDGFYQSLAFDQTAQFLYVARMLGGDYHLLQFDLFSGDPSQSVINVVTFDGYTPLEAMELGPDNRLYITTEEVSSGPGGGLSPASKLHVVEKPWLKGIACTFVSKAVKLDPGTTCSGGLSCRITNSLPDGVSDRTTVDPGYEKPLITTAQFCFGDETKFAVINDFGADSVKWVFSNKDSVYAKNTSYVYAEPGKHTAIFKWYLCGFEYVKKVDVFIGVTPLVNLGNDTILCHGTAITLSGSTGADGYKWSTGDTTFTIVVKAAGMYAVEVRNGDCKSGDEVAIGYYPSLWTDLGDEYFICNDDKELVKLDAGEKFEQYKWTPTGDTTQWIIVGDVGDYFVVVKDFRGCNGNDGTQVKRRCPVSVHFPNIFTPNNDGLNDHYVPKGKDVVNFTMKIYNRWGQLVFETSDISKTWNGVVKGEAANAEVYVYTATYSGYFNKRLREFTAKGSFTLLR